MNISIVLFVFFYMLQVLYLNVSKVDRDVGHVAMLFQVCVPNVLSVFKRMLQMFHLDVAERSLFDFGY
jgi:hypothetical protein